MKTLSVREFRKEWTVLSGDVVRVTARGRTLGHWVPGDNPLKWSDPADPDHEWTWDSLPNDPDPAAGMPYTYLGTSTTIGPDLSQREGVKPELIKPVVPDIKKAQAKRDEVLRKVNRKEKKNA